MPSDLERRGREYVRNNPGYGDRARRGNPNPPPQRLPGPGDRPGEYRPLPPGSPEAARARGQQEGEAAAVSDFEQRYGFDPTQGLDGQGALGDPLGGYWEGPQQTPDAWRLHGLPTNPNYPARGPDEPYYEGDEVALLRARPAEERRRIQDLLVATGLTNSVIPGEIDDGTVSGFQRLLGMANRNGEHWQSTFSRLQRGLDSGEIGPDAEQRDPFRFVEQEYLPPDPAEIRNAVRDLAARIVPDVALSDEEVDSLRQQFEGFGRAEFNAAEQQRENDARAEYAASAPVTAGSGTEEVIVESGAIPQTSAADRFREYFEERYSANIARGEDREEEGERRKVTDSNLGNLLAIATGG